MGGFKNEITNRAFAAGAINFIIAHLTNCSKQMKEDCIATDKLLKNNEDAITNRLVAKYLNEKPSAFRYEPQAPEHYDCETDLYIGRIDIKVTSGDYFLRDSKAYYIIECKRIDGSSTLNKKYITDGVERFFSLSPLSKYSSYYMQNIMFGYVVKTTVIPDNVDKIDRLQGTLLKGAKPSGFTLEQSDAPQCYVYKCKYDSDNIGQVELSHLFFDFVDAIHKR